MDVLIERLVDNTGDILPVKRVEIESTEELPEKCKYLPKGIYYASTVDKGCKFQDYLTTIVIDKTVKCVKSDCDKHDLELKHGKIPNK